MAPSRRSRRWGLGLWLLAAGVVLAMKAEDIAERWGPSILCLAVEGGEQTGEGSGFFINETQAVTNWHVVKGAEKILAIGRDEVVREVRVVASLPEHDLALIEFSEPAGKGKAMEIREAPAKDLETVYVCGNPNSMRFVWSDGKVGNASQKNIRGECIQITAPISPGSSGGPLLDAEGKVIGVVVGYLPDGQNLNFAIPAKHIRNLRAGEKGEVSEKGLSWEVRVERFEEKIDSLSVGEIRREVDEMRRAGQPDPFWMGELAVLLIRRDLAETAIPLLEEVLGQNPDSARGWANLGLAHFKTGSREKSAKAYGKALELAPDDENITIQAARAYERLGEGDKAERVLEEALSRNPRWRECAEALKKIRKE